MATFLEKVTSRIQSYDNSFSGDYGSVDKKAMKKDGWKRSSQYTDSVYPVAVAHTTISAGSVDSGTNSDWGLDHFKTNLRKAILGADSLVPYKCTKSGFEKYVVFVKNNIFKFNTVNDAYFDMTHGAAEYFSARYYFDEISDTTNRDLAQADGESYIDNYSI